MAPLKRLWIPSPNYSSRGGAGVRLIVIHTAEGALTIESLGSFFSSPSSQASSHVGADDTPDTVGEYVRRYDKAWTCADYNAVSVNIEMCAFAEWSTDQWMQHPNMLSNCAAWIAQEAEYYAIPITKLSPSDAQDSGRGVCFHSDLGIMGGGHHDPGPGFPVDYVLNLARGEPGTPTPPKEEDIVAITCGQNKAGAFHVFVEAKDGSIWRTWQKPGETAWQGGEKGKSPAKLEYFAPAPK